MDGGPSELSMADFAPAWRTHTARLADGIGREIVMEHEALLIRSLQAVDILLVLAGAERRDDQSLRLTTGEQSRTVGTRKHTDLREDRADRRQIAAVDTALVVENVPAHDLG